MLSIAVLSKAFGIIVWLTLTYFLKYIFELADLILVGVSVITYINETKL